MYALATRRLDSADNSFSYHATAAKVLLEGMPASPVRREGRTRMYSGHIEREMRISCLAVEKSGRYEQVL